MATIITKTIGQDGWQDFSGIQQATDAITTSDVANTADLVAADKAVVFEIYAGTYTEGTNINEGLTCDATRNVTYKPAAGSEHGGDFNAGVRVVFNTAGNGCFNIEDDFTHIVGLVCTTDTGAVGNRGLIQANAGGILVEGCILQVEHSTPWCLFSNQGGATAVNVYQNNLLRNANERPIALYSIAAPTSHEFINNTIEGHGDRAIFYQVLGNSMTVEAVNNFIFNVNNWAQGNSSGGSTFTTTGSGNFIDVVGSNMGAGVAAMEGTVTTDTTAPSTGNQAIYTSATGALVNVSGNDAVGVCDGTVAPATDINGEDRIRGAASEYADPGAFTTDKVSITKILDVDGDGDFDNTFDARDAMDDTLHELLGGTRNNLAQRNGEVIYAAKRGVFPRYPIAWNLNSFDNAITGPGNSFTIKAVEGHEHKGVTGAGPVFPEDGTSSYTFATDIPFAKFQDIQLSRVDTSDGRANFGLLGSPSGLTFDNIIFTQQASATTQGHQIAGISIDSTFDDHIYVNNCLFDEKTNYALQMSMLNGPPAHFHMNNCTVLECARFFGLDNNSVNQPASVTLINNVVPDGQLFGVQYNPPAPFPGSHSNVAALPNSNVLPASAIAGSTGWTFTTSATAPSTGSQVIYDDTTYKLLNVSGNDAVGVGDGTVAPTTDILGNARIRGAANEYADPGAFSTELITATRTIGKDGWQDFTTFTNAEAEADTIANELLGGSRLNLAERNGKIVYEAYAATYQETTTVSFQDNITAGPGNGVTYQPASGSEHLGVSGEGVYLVRPADSQNLNCLSYNDYFTLDGLSFYNQQNNARAITLQGAVNGVTIKNCLVHADISNGVCVQTSTRSAGSIAPNVFENNVFRWQGNYGLYLAQAQGSETDPGKAVVNNNTFQASWVGGVCLGFADTGSYLDVSANNNLLVSGLSMYVLGSVRITGQGNFDVQVNQSGPYAPLPENIRGSAAPITVVTETSAISTGSQTVIDADTLALVNVSGNDIVGLGSGSAISVPANDILGNSRIRGASNEYADPGAFSTDLITATKIIDINEGFPYDYSNIKDGYDDQSNTTRSLLGGTRLNLAQRNGNLVYEVRSGRYGLQTTDLPSYWTAGSPSDPLITSPGRSVTIRPEIGSEHNGSFSEGVLLRKTTGNMTYFSAPFMEINGLVIMSPDSGGGYYGPGADGEGVKFKNCLVDWSNTNRDCLKIGISTVEHPIIVENCLLKTDSTFSIRRALVIDPNSHSKIKNCTLIHTLNSWVIGVDNGAEPATTSVELTNCSLISTQGIKLFGNATFTGSNNICGPTDPLPASTLAEDQTWTFSTSATAPSTGAQLIYDDTTYKLLNVSGNDAVGVGTGTGAPTTDILGNSRIRGADNEYADPGAFTTDLITATKIIDVNFGPGYNYSGFLEAENDVDEVAHELLGGTRENLAQRNGSIVFEARAGTYTDPLNINSNLVSDPTRNITYKTAAGSEHGGTTGTGVIIDTGASNRPVNITDDFAVVDGFNLVTTTTYCAFVESVGATVRNCIATVFNRGFTAFGGLENAPIVFENCVAQGGSGYAFLALGGGPASPNTHVRMVNCTGSSTGNDAFRSQATAAGTSTTAEYINCVGLSTYTHQEVGSFVKVTGSNNVGGTINRWPEATRAEGQVWTFTTDTTASSTGSQVIYTLATGALVNVSGNDAIGVGDGTKAPTTDINGVDRIRSGLGIQYADPGAFTSDIRTISKTIDSTGNGDYTTIFASEAALALSIPNPLSTNLVLRNEEIVFNTIPGQTITETSHISVTGVPPSGPKNRIIWRCPDPTNRTLVDSTSTIGVFILKVPYIKIENLNFRTEKYAVSFSADSGSDVVGCLIKNCVIDAYGTLAGLKATKSTSNSVGTREEPNVVENVVTKSLAAISTYWPTNPEHAGTAAAILFRNCTHMDSTGAGITQNNAWNWEAASIRGHDYSIMEIHNCLNLASGGFDSPGVTEGSGNVGNSSTGNNSFSGKGVGINLNPTTNTSPGVGDWSIYTSATGELVNVSANDAVGVGIGTEAPTTDILGNSRIRGASNEYADPGAFSVDKITYTSSIGLGGAASGFDYGNFTDAEAEVTTIPYAENLAQRNLAIVFNASAGTYGTSALSFIPQSTLIMGPDNNVTYQASSGSEHSGNKESGVIVNNRAIVAYDSFQTFDGLVIKPSDTNGVQPRTEAGFTLRNCIVEAVEEGVYDTAYGGGTPDNPHVMENCLIYSPGRALRVRTVSDGGSLPWRETANWRVRNNTFINVGATTNRRVILNSVHPTKPINLEFTNNINFDSYSFQTDGTGSYNLSGSNNFGAQGTSVHEWPQTIKAEGQTWTFTTDTTASSTGDQVIYTSATGELVNVSGNDAVGVGTGTGVPTTDILGNSRIRGANNEYTDPGAFSTEKVTFTKKIGPYREYTTFTDAEADVVAISTNGNLAERNEAIVFRADAGTYSENFSFFTNGGITCDPTRNVTWKNGLGSEHGGQFGGGVNIVGSCAVQENFAVVDGLSVSPTTGAAASISLGAIGVILRNLMSHSTNNRAFTLSRGGSAAFPGVVENCVGKSDSSRAFDIRSDGAESHWRVINCTAMATGINQGFIIGQSSSYTVNLELANNVVNGGTARSYYADPTPTVVVTGSNNVGPDDGSAPFPAAVQAEGQTWTTTTNTTAAPTGNQVVYEAATGKMLAVSGNDAIGIGTLSAAPTTDINGTSRLRGVGTQYVDPGAFTSDVNTITKTIGIGGAASGFDFGGFLEAEAAVDTTAVTYNSNLAEKNIAIVFEADAGTYEEELHVSNSLVCDPTHNVIFQGESEGGTVVESSTTGKVIRITNGAFTHLKRLKILSTGISTSVRAIFIEPEVNTSCQGILLDSITFENTVAQYFGMVESNLKTTASIGGTGSETHPTVIQNCVGKSFGGGIRTVGEKADETHIKVVNFTLICTNNSGNNSAFSFQATGDIYIEILNCITTGFRWDYRDTGTGSVIGTGSNNLGNTSSEPFPIALQAEGQIWTTTTDTTAPSTGNQVIYTSATGALVNVSGNDAIGVGTGSAINVPATDILGKSRLRGLSNEYADPGAFTTDIETTTLTANPGTLSAIIDNLTPYITTTNIAKRNESIVIELTKADYPHLNFNNNESIIGDSVRNITVKPEEGAHHKGILGAGIRFISANTGYDTFSLQNVNGFTLEGVELYTPADDIGRYLTVTRFSDAILYKDVILNSVECDGKITTQSWYNNGRLSPLSFRNCLFLTNGGCFNAGTVTAQENQGTYEFTNCTLSGLAESRSIWQFDAVHSGTFNVNLTNNLILSEKRNVGNRWIGNDVGFFGDVFVYGRNNFGPDTPNYQLPTAVRGSIYPILPTFDYTPVPASPAAVYRPGTLQLLDIPDNDVLQLGVGTDDPLVPLQGIGEDSRSTSSCNPGCWEDDYELVDLRINTFDGSTGIVDPYFGPPTDIANAVLPDATVPVFIVIGDSTAQGFSVEINDARSYREATDYWPTNAFDGSAYGYFWNKYMTTPDNGVTWTRDISYISPDTSGDAFLPINPRMGGIGVGTFTYSDPLPVSTVPAGNCSPLWDFSLAISGIFRNSAGETLTPHFIFLASTGSRLGSNGPTFLGNDEYNFSPSGYLFNTLNQSYIKPAVDHLMNNGKHPLLVGTLIMAGGTEANISYNPTPDGSKVSTSGAATYVNFLSATEAAAKVSGRAPWIAYEVWDSGSSDYPEVYSKLMQKALYGLKDISITRRINMQNLERDKGTTAQNTDIHFVQYKYPDYGRQFAGAYRALLTWRRSPIFGRTLSEIFNE